MLVKDFYFVVDLLNKATIYPDSSICAVKAFSFCFELRKLEEVIEGVNLDTADELKKLDSFIFSYDLDFCLQMI